MHEEHRKKTKNFPNFPNFTKNFRFSISDIIICQKYLKEIKIKTCCSINKIVTDVL